MDLVIAFIALTAMEIVLGIDNIVFIAILAGRLPENQRARARTLGLAAALVTRILLLLSLKWILGLTAPIFHLSDFLPDTWFSPEILPDAVAESAEQGVENPHMEINAVSWRDLILLGGGLFLIGKSVLEIHHKIEGDEKERDAKAASFTGVIIQIAILDIVFSLDSVITAVGMVDPEQQGALAVMIGAIVVAIVVMLVSAGKVSAFIDKHPTLKILALSFLILIGVLLVAEGIGTHMNKGYIYFAMAFSLVVEMINMKIRGKRRFLRAKPRETGPASAET
ncbi:MAG: TerC family protein [Planctomycetota bacterium]|nr:MAG: TerC family protein [Planctomycetota bacterium]REJ90584.1 MAG: TerC family protein [Planctomycetota bacterium]